MKFPTKPNGLTERQWSDWRTALKAAVAVARSLSYGGDSVEWLGSDELEELTLVVTTPSLAEHAWTPGLPLWGELFSEKDDKEVEAIANDVSYACAAAGATDDWCEGTPRHNRKFSEKCDAELRRVLEAELGPERTADLGLAS